MAKKKMRRAKKGRDINGIGNLLVSSGLFIGMGAGIILGSLFAGLFMGLGTGLLLMALVRILKKK